MEQIIIKIPKRLIRLKMRKPKTPTTKVIDSRKEEKRLRKDKQFYLKEIENES